MTARECNIEIVTSTKPLSTEALPLKINLTYIVISRNICFVFSMIFVMLLLHVLPLATLTDAFLMYLLRS